MLQYNVRNILADPRIVIPVEENLELTSISEGSGQDCESGRPHIEVYRFGRAGDEDALQPLYGGCGCSGEAGVFTDFCTGGIRSQ